MSEPTHRLPPNDAQDADAARRGDATAATPEERRGRFTDRDLPVAIASGLILAAAFIGSVLWHPAAFTAVVAALVVLGLIETSRSLEDHDWPVALPVLTVAALVILGGAYRAGTQGLILGVVVLFVGAIAWDLADPDRHRVVQRVAGTILVGIWLPVLGAFAVLLITRPRDGGLAVVATAGAAIVSDIGAYVVGTRFGRTQLAPTVSPGKTWEGVLGGLALTAVLGAIVLPLLGDLFTWPLAAVFVLVVSVASVVGDLAESMVKRDLGIKDIGGVIPGHGGILDRVDAILFALPTGYFVLELLGR